MNGATAFLAVSCKFFVFVLVYVKVCTSVAASTCGHKICHFMGGHWMVALMSWLTGCKTTHQVTTTPLDGIICIIIIMLHPSLSTCGHLYSWKLISYFILLALPCSHRSLHIHGSWYCLASHYL